MRRLLWAVVLLASAGAADAQGLTKSVRPPTNPFHGAVDAALPPAPVTVQVVDASQQLPASAPPFTSIRPRPRPDTIAAATAPPPQDVQPPAVAEAAVAPKGILGRLLKPKPRPAGLQPREEVTEAAIRTKPSRKAIVSKKGSVCGDPAIKGEVLSPIKAKVKGCGVPDPVRVTSVAGVRLSQAATIDCPTAKALKTWVERGLQPAFGRKQVVELKIAAHYICRTRNNQRGAKISEHGRGKAVDIAGFVLADGSELSVQGNYNKSIRRAHKAACGIFGTTLGPGSDGFHEDHLHFDTAGYRSGPYCR